MSARVEKETKNLSSIEAPPLERIICSKCKWGLEVVRHTFSALCLASDSSFQVYCFFNTREAELKMGAG